MTPCTACGGSGVREVPIDVLRLDPLDPLPATVMVDCSRCASNTERRDPSDIRMAEQQAEFEAKRAQRIAS